MNEQDKIIGLYPKYSIHRVDGSDAPGQRHADCFKFVLDLEHDPFALAAMTAYANACRYTYPQLAREILDKVAEKEAQ